MVALAPRQSFSPNMSQYHKPMLESIVEMSHQFGYLTEPPCLVQAHRNKCYLNNNNNNTCPNENKESHNG